MKRSGLAGIALVVVLVATLGLLAGCGGSSGSSSSDETAKFKASYGSVGNQFREISRAIGTGIERARSQSDAQLAVTFHALAARWQDQLSQLETLKPPANLAATFNTLTGAASRAEADLNAIVAAAETHNKSAAEQASASLVTDIESAKSASTTITP
jgi:hypothetical protein